MTGTRIKAKDCGKRIRLSGRLENHHAQGRQEKFGRGRLVVHGYVFRRDAAAIAAVGAGVNPGVAVQDFLPLAGVRHADAIMRTRHRREVQDDDGVIFPIRGLAQEERTYAKDLLTIETRPDTGFKENRTSQSPVIILPIAIRTA